MTMNALCMYAVLIKKWLYLTAFSNVAIMKTITMMKLWVMIVKYFLNEKLPQRFKNEAQNLNKNLLKQK